MAVNIRIGNVRLTSDSDCWMVCEVKDRKVPDKRGNMEIRRKRSYYASLTQALTAMQDRNLRTGDADSIEKLLDELRDFRATLLGRFTLEAKA